MKSRLIFALCLLLIAHPSTARTAHKSDTIRKISETKPVAVEHSDSPTVHIEINGNGKQDLAEFALSAGIKLNDDRLVEMKNRGLGFIIDSQGGYIVTTGYSFDKFEHIENIDVTLNDGTHHKAKLIGRDDQGYVAVLQIDATKLNAVKWHNDTPKIGDQSFTLGDPGNAQSTLASGKIVRLDLKGPDDKTNFMTIDNEITSGMGGGPVVDSQGRVIGMIFAKMPAETESSASLGIVLPSILLHETALQIISKAQ